MQPSDNVFVIDLQYTSVLSTLGFMGAVLLFCWLIVFQFRKNLIEERRILNTYIPSAPNPDGECSLICSRYVGLELKPTTQIRNKRTLQQLCQRHAIELDLFYL